MFRVRRDSSEVSNLFRALEPYRARLERDLTTALHQQERSAVCGHIAVVILLSLLLRNELRGTTLAIWVGTIIAASGFRMWNSRRFQRLTATHVGMRDQWLHTVGILGCGLSWSIGFVLVMHSLSLSRARSLS